MVRFCSPTWLSQDTFKCPLIFFDYLTLYIMKAVCGSGTWHHDQCRVSVQVEHRGVMPSLVPKPGAYLQIVDQRKQLREVIWSCWPAVSQPSPHQPDLPFVVSTFCALFVTAHFFLIFLRLQNARIQCILLRA